MDSSTRINSAFSLLREWYVAAARELPWRMNGDAYSVWISEIMLQQTRISAVVEYYARFMRALPTIQTLAEVDDDELLKLWQGLGYYNRARNLKKTAQILVEKYNGSFPADYDAIRALPGIGEYTAGAISSIAFSIPVPAVDGNVLRVMTRLLNDSSDISAERTKKQYRQMILPHIPKEDAGNLNQAIMELGETICLPNGAPLCAGCPLSGLCMAYQLNTTDRIPVKTPPKARKIEERKVLLAFREGRVALRKRPSKGLLAGLWEYPNYSAAEGEKLAGDGFDESSLPEPCAEGIHVFSHIEWHMKAYTIELSGKLPEGWVLADYNQLQNQYAVPNAFRFVEESVKNRIL
ncbi:MAG: A/G-specific adenine glycosylase [Oscillospiraceae bacterium]|nr:A/G-specific adenine glycosylase [Oscillospiraceae bacterium]